MTKALFVGLNGNWRSFAGVFFLLGASFVASAAEQIDLRGYGKVSADLTPNKTVFDCESVQKADILLDKLQADLFWDKTLPVKKSEVKLGATPVTIYSLPGYGAALIARAGNQVIVLGGNDEGEVSFLAAKEPLLQRKDVTSQAAKPHPLFLDYFDIRAFKAYVPPMRTPKNFGLESHWPFLKLFGGSTAFFGPQFHFASPAPGVIDWAPDDYEVREAERQGEMVVIGPGGGGEMPLWVANASPDTMMRPSETTSLGDWGGAGMVGAHYESWATPTALRWKFALGFFRRAMERYRTSENVGGWMPFAGSPGVEYNFHGKSMHSWDTSPTGQEGWRKWLREARHFSLADLGTRWYGDAVHFAQWEDVTLPDSNEFYGKLGADSLRIHDGWRWRNVKEFSNDILSPKASGWIPMAMPPMQQQSFIARSGINYFDVTFDSTEWQKQRSDKNVWLVFGMIGVGNDAARVWLNGKLLELPKDGASKAGPFSLPVANSLQPGINHLQVAINPASWATCAGMLAGPVFFTIHEPKRLPYMGPQDNARYVDSIEWKNWAMTQYHREMFTLARKLDPDRPFVLSGAGSDVADYGVQMCVDYGMGLENTGREAHYAPENGAQGIAAGYYGTSEWSGTPSRHDPQRGDLLERGFGWILFDADSSHCLYHNIEDFQQMEKDDQWFTRHHRQIEMFGKYLRQPKVALLRSIQSIRFDSPELGSWDLGRGELQAAHYDNTYVTEMGLKAGYADAYPVLFDTGSEFMEADTVEAIRRYVENGGTFVMLHNTARHTSLEPDCYPLAKISGFKVTRQSKGGRLKFESNLPVFKGWEGKEFDGWGMAVDWLDADHAKDGIALSPADKDAVVLARWKDGTAAIGCRQIGKGRIIVMGTTFWRGGKDIQGIWRTRNELESQFFHRLFSDCGIERDADSNVSELWARRMVTKNGLQNWLVSYNSRNEPVQADVWMATDGKPQEVISLDANVPVSFVYENNGVRIKDLNFKPYEVKAFAVKRATLAGALPTWWHEKEIYWKRTPTQIAASQITLPDLQESTSPDVIPLDRWHFSTDPDNSIVAYGKWVAEEFNDSSWQLKESGPWNLLDDKLKDYHGVGLYRIKFKVASSWNGRRILLNLFNWDTPIVYDTGDFSINGRKVFTYKAHYWSQTYNLDVTSLVHPGENVLTLQATAGPKLGGLSGSVWIEAWEPLAPVLDLNGTWQAVQGDWVTRGDTVVPGSTTAKCLRKEISIPADWKGKTVFVEWSSKERWIGCIVVNGSPLCNNAYAHPFGLWTRLNVSNHLKPGENNVIEVWPFRTMTLQGGNAENGEEKGLQLTEIRIGVQAHLQKK